MRISKVAFLSVVILLIGLFRLEAQDYSQLTSSNHPRLFLKDIDLIRLKVILDDPTSKDSLTLAIHNNIINRSEELFTSTREPSYSFDKSGLRLLDESRLALERIFYFSYTFRVTGDERFLQSAISDLETVCSFPDWNATSHFLDAAELATAVAIGYDWLYERLSEQLKDRIVSCLQKNVFQPANDETVASFYYSEGNWNQVCNAGLSIAALSVYEMADTTAQRVINDSVWSNRRGMRSIYSPYGYYSEGPGYWSYGNVFQCMMLSAFESCLGNDFGLSMTAGFDRTAYYKTFTDRPAGKVFNYSDNIERPSPSYPLWYFATRFNDTSLIDKEIGYLKDGLYLSADEHRLLPLLVRYSLKLTDGSSYMDKHPYKSNIYFSDGKNSTVMVKGRLMPGDEYFDGFHGNANDYYLGIKGGTSVANHSHLDGGSFVYDAYGHSWVVDLDRQDYESAESICRQEYGNFWDMSQTSLRWQLLRMNNLGHSTATVNGRLFNVKGDAKLVKVIDTIGVKGGVFDNTSLYDGEVTRYERTITVDSKGSLRIEDVVTAPYDTSCSIRWNIVTPSTVEVTKEGILLCQEGVSMRLEVMSDVPFSYSQFSADPKDYDFRLSDKEDKNPGISMCGFVSEVKKGETVVLTTVLERIF